MSENDLSKITLDAAYCVHTALGLESVYEIMLAHELQKRVFKTTRQEPVPIRYDGLEFEVGFRRDLVVEDSVIVELKSIEILAPAHAKQLLTQLRLSNRKLGLLINFGEVHLENGIKRASNGVSEEPVSFQSLLVFPCDLSGRCVMQFLA